jgi:glycosyltransferase involved in cell wall biosynthesis
MKERVIFTGEISERELISEIYRDAKIFAFPSRWESFGIALTEAMMNGCFCVASRIPSSVNLTENLRFAFGHDVDDIDSLAKNLLYACTHEYEIEALAIEGRNATLKRCDLKSVCETIAEGLK